VLSLTLRPGPRRRPAHRQEQDADYRGAQ